MCGINGILTANAELKNKIITANSLIKHRGPDDEGYVIINKTEHTASQFSGSESIEAVRNKYPLFPKSNNNFPEVILAHRRLSIIDLSEKGHCPMSDIEEKIWITYNGEIYNYIELREELKQYGYIFRTNSDTEVIINAYLQWGFECLNKFNGMWAFAIWDNRNETLFLARDRFGIKPLYYSFNNEYFAFSSEIKPLVLYNSTNIGLNKDKIPFYLIFGNRLNVNDTYLNGINSLQASHYLICKNNKCNLKKYYEINNQDNQLNEEQLKVKIADLLVDSIRLRFRSDVPVGSCLSGGFDSTSIVSLSSGIGKNSIETFSAVWNEKDCDESYYIDIVNSKYNCVSNKIIPGEEEFESVFNKLCYYQEIPTEGPGLYPQWFVMSKAKEKVKVLLDGQGGDEVFGGYFQSGAYLRGIIKDRKFSKLITEPEIFLKFLKKNGVHSFSSWLFPGFYGYLTRSKLSSKYGILNKDLYDTIEKSSLKYDYNPTEKFGNYLGNLSYHLINNVTVPSLLHYEDRSSMAHSIESRVPFLDYRLVELGINLKSIHLSNKGISRPLYRKALTKYLPEEIVKRKDKLGFPTPFSAWTKGLLKNFILDNLHSGSNDLSDYVDKSILESNLKNHFNGIKDYSWEIWRLLSLSSFINLFKRFNVG